MYSHLHWELWLQNGRGVGLQIRFMSLSESWALVRSVIKSRRRPMTNQFCREALRLMPNSWRLNRSRLPRNYYQMGKQA
jgi:hypothetical protein